MGRFANVCLSDIATLKCGRNEVSSPKSRLPHSQGKTIECLSDNVQQLTDPCAVINIFVSLCNVLAQKQKQNHFNGNFFLNFFKILGRIITRGRVTNG